MAIIRHLCVDFMNMRHLFGRNSLNKNNNHWREINRKKEEKKKKDCTRFHITFSVEFYTIFIRLTINFVYKLLEKKNIFLYNATAIELHVIIIFFTSSQGVINLQKKFDMDSLAMCCLVKIKLWENLNITPKIFYSDQVCTSRLPLDSLREYLLLIPSFFYFIFHVVMLLSIN